MEQQEAQFRTLYNQFLAWQQSQQNQTDGYCFEKSFAEFCQKLNTDLFALAVGVPLQAKQRPKKKS